MDTLYPCGHTKGLLHVYHYTVDRPRYTWIHCIHAGIPRGYYMYTTTQWTVHGIQDTLYPCGYTKGLVHVYHYTVDRPRYTWIHCIHAGIPRDYYMYTITQWTVHSIHGYIVSMRAHQGAIMYVPLHSGPSMVYMDTLYPCRHTKGCTITQWTVHGIHGYIVSMWGL